MTKLLFIDTECGGLEKDSTLLTLSMIVTDEKLQTIDLLSMCIKPADGISYVVSAEGLAVNKINIIEHDKIAISIDVAKQQVYQFIKMYSSLGKDKLIPCGHGISFDLIKIWDNLIKRGSWEQFCSYRTIDTGSVGRFLILARLLPADIHGGLSKYCEALGVKHKGVHTAQGDNVASIELLRTMLRLTGKIGI